MEIPSKILEQNAFNTRTKIEEHMLVVMDKSNHEEHLSQPLQTKNKQFKTAVTFLTGYNGIFKITDKNIKFYFFIPLTVVEPSFNNIPIEVYELEILDAKIKRICINDGHFREDNYPFNNQPNFSTLGYIIEIDVGVGR